MAAMLHRDPTELVGTPIDHVFDSDTAYQLRCELQKHPLSNCIHIDAGLSTPDHTGGWVHIAASRFVEEEGCRYVILVTDITEHVQSEQEARDENIELEKRVADRTKTLESLNGELKAFSYSVSHDLREPMRAISGYSHMLVEDHREHLDEDGKHCIDRIIASITKMSEMVDGMLRLSRLTTAELQIKDISLSQVVQTICEDLEKSNPNRKVVFEIQPNVWSAMLGNTPKIATKPSSHLARKQSTVNDDSMLAITELAFLRNRSR
jgi:signal transduction histidine kinase